MKRQTNTNPKNLTFGENRGLAAELLQDLGGSGETISTLSDGDVEDQLLDLDFPHGVRELLLRCLKLGFYIQFVRYEINSFIRLRRRETERKLREERE
jgi:hypothetical protein